MAACMQFCVIVTKFGKVVSLRSMQFSIAVLLCATMLTSVGCISFMANVMRVVKGTDAPAEFDELKEKKVAVVVTTSAGMNSDATGIIVCNYVHALLATNVKKIQMINQEEIGRILNDLPAGEHDMTKIGSRLNADYVVAIEVTDLKLHDGPTLYKGRSSSSVEVYKVSDGNSPVFRKLFPDFVYPQMGMPSTDTDEATFQRFYLSEISQRMARIFYPFDPTVDVAKDAAVASVQSFR